MKKRSKQTSKATSRSPRSSAARGSGVEAALQAVARAMKALGAPWYLFGAQAVALHGAQRTTQDIDVTVLTTAPDARVIAVLKRSGLVPRFDDADFVARTRVIPCEHGTSGWKVDVVLGGPGFEEQIAAESVETKVGRTRVPLLRLEHLLVLKTLAGRSHDLSDISRLLEARSDVDHAEVIRLLRLLEADLDEPGLAARYALLRYP